MSFFSSSVIISDFPRSRGGSFKKFLIKTWMESLKATESSRKLNLKLEKPVNFWKAFESYLRGAVELSISQLRYWHLSISLIIALSSVVYPNFILIDLLVLSPKQCCQTTLLTAVQFAERFEAIVISLWQNLSVPSICWIIASRYRAADD